MNDPTPEELRRVAAWLDERSDTYDAGTKQVVRFLRGKAGETPAPRFRTVAERAPEPGTVIEVEQDPIREGAKGICWVDSFDGKLYGTTPSGFDFELSAENRWRPVAGPFQVEGES